MSHSYGTSLEVDIEKIIYVSFVRHVTELDYKKRTCHKVTNLSNRGLISEDRSTKATLLFTIPRSCLSRLHRISLWKF